MNVVILGGGDSPEREVSLRSAAAVSSAARQAGHEVKQADPADGYQILDNIPYDCVVLPILHGVGGEDGSIQAELESRSLPYLGADSKVSAECFDKWLTREKLISAGVPMPKASLVDESQYQQHELRRLPHVLKTPKGGSSIGTLIVRQPTEARPEDVRAIFDMDSKAIIEELIIGTETTVPILDNSALKPVEIIPPDGVEFDYENKYNGRTQELCPPQNISAETQLKCQQLAESVHETMACRHLSRVDIMIDRQRDIFVLEINTIPGLTDQSLYPKSAAEAGLDMPALVDKFIRLVCRDYGLN